MIAASPLRAALPESVGRALWYLGSPAAERWLPRFLDATAESIWPDVAWRSSLLTPGGFPLELSFSTAAPDVVRYATEVAGPESQPGDRLGSALELLRRWDIPPPLSPVLAVLQEAQVVSPVRWGCWLGARHGSGGDRFKLYVEVPPRITGVVANRSGALLERRPRLLDQGELRLVGLGCGSTDTELYYRLGRVERSSADAIFREEGLGARSAEILDLIDLAAGREFPVNLPGANVCASVAISPSGSSAVSLISHCVGLFGLDAACRSRMLALVDRLGLQLGPYEAVSRPLESTPAAARHHTMIAFTAGPDGPPQMSIGLRPPDPKRPASNGGWVPEMG